MKTWQSPNLMLEEFQIDNVSMTNPKQIMQVKVQRGANFDFDHWLTRIKIKLFLPTPSGKSLGYQSTGLKS